MKNFEQSKPIINEEKHLIPEGEFNEEYSDNFEKNKEIKVIDLNDDELKELEIKNPVEYVALMKEIEKIKNL